jgi:hypothetical protein
VALTDFHRKHSTEEALKNMAAQTALKRIGVADECGPAAVFLSAHSGRFITGEIVEINGGIWLA